MKTFPQFVVGCLIYLAFAMGGSLAVAQYMIKAEMEDPIKPIEGVAETTPTPMVNVVPSGVSLLDLEAGYYLDTRLQGEQCSSRGGRIPRDGYGCEVPIDKTRMLVIDPNNPPSVVIGGK